MFYLGLGLLIAVPAFKTITHLPPFMGILFGLAILWVVGDLIHRDKEPDEKKPLTLVHALKQIDMASIVFFIGILLAVATLEHTHVLEMLAKWLDESVGRQDVIVVLLGLLSAIVDNVPLVAASMGMYSLAQYRAGQLPVGVHRLLCRDRRLNSDHRLGGGRGCNGPRKNSLLLVRQAHQSRSSARTANKSPA